MMSYQIRARPAGAISKTRRKGAIMQRTHSLDVLHNDPQVRALEVRAVVFRDMGRIELGENLNLLLNIFDLVFRTLQIDDLNGHRFLGALVITGVDKRVNRVVRCEMCTYPLYTSPKEPFPDVRGVSL